MTAPVRPGQLVRGHPHHGVAQYARQLAEAAGCPVAEHPVRPSAGRVHLHFTDRIWGHSPGEAAERIERIAQRHRLSVTLHDLPAASDGPAARAPRADAYRRVVGAARAVACNSHWERSLLDELGVAVSAAVIPLPVTSPPVVRRPAGPAPGAAGAATVGLLGWLYPGKGHADVIAAVAAVAARPGAAPCAHVVSLGGVSEGHAEEADSLQAEADRRGVAFSITGYLPDADLAAQAARITVPVAAHRHISASGSINSWLGLGRRPLVTDSVYVREMTELRPGTLTVCSRQGLADAVARALAEPETTWLAPDVDLGPDMDAVAASYLSWWSEVVPW